MKKAVVTLMLALSVAVATYAAGTALNVTFGTPTVECPGGVVNAPYTVSATSASAAAVTETLTNSSNVLAAFNSYTILAGNVTDGGGWTFAGRTKTRDGVFHAAGLPNGTYTLEVCATQPGSNGNPSKSDCKTETILVNCGGEPSACTATPFGEVVGNPHIGTNATAQLQFRGDFGDPATVRITGPNFDSDYVSIGENGNSCNYHVNWSFTSSHGNGADVVGNGGPGVYQVVVTGNGNSLQFAVTLVN